MSRTALVAIGGNSLITDSKQPDVPHQWDAVRETCTYLADMVVGGWNLVVTHGNGPQVGFIMRRSELARGELHEIPMDVAGADTQGAIGYALQQNLINDFRAMGIDKLVATVVTQVEVSATDPAMLDPSKPIGTFLDEQEAKRRRDEEGWMVKEDAGRGWRRVVASPQPIRIVEIDVIRLLIDSGVVVICVGGGGIPVVADENGDLFGVAAVIDKDVASALLALEIGADMLLISTAVEKVALAYGTPDQRWVDQLTLSEVKSYLAEGGHFAEGSMAPKMRAVVRFLEGGGKEALITNPESIERAVAGETGTRIVHG